jgi:lipid-A-disaccharide synthase
MTTPDAPHLFICAGDVSGDQHAARLVAALRRKMPAARITALGGSRLRAAADTFLADLTALSAFGFFQPFKQYFRLRTIWQQLLLPCFDRDLPSKVILVDYYGFNIHVAREAARRGIPVYYYVSPQIWASRPGRIRSLAKAVTRMLVILPFEEQLYRAAGVTVTFVGHPLIDAVPVPVPQPQPAPTRPLIGLFPGSRRSVFQKHLPILEQAAVRIQQAIPDADIRIFTLEHLRAACQGSRYPVVVEDGYQERGRLSLAITTSGTVSLENALLGIPMIVMYRLSSFNYAIAKLFVKVRYITLVNILADRAVVPELIQHDATPSKIAAAAIALLTDERRRRKMIDELKSFRTMLGTPGVSDRAAAAILAEPS